MSLRRNDASNTPAHSQITTIAIDDHAIFDNASAKAAGPANVKTAPKANNSNAVVTATFASLLLGAVIAGWASKTGKLAEANPRHGKPSKSGGR
jgi:hypothetical protein